MPNKGQAARSGAGGDLQDRISALGSSVRREILFLVWNDEMAAGEIAAAFSLTKPTISQHLSVLRDAGLVTSRAVGTSRLFRASRDALHGLSAALSDPGKWRTADDIPEVALSNASTKGAVIVWVDVPIGQDDSFRAFTDASVFTAWLGVPVSIDRGRFSCTLEWGTHIRGRYEVVSPPDLIAMEWDFEDDNVPIPGRALPAYLRMKPNEDGSTHVEVQQIIDRDEQGPFMEAAWSLVLGRFNAGAGRGLGSDTLPVLRVPRQKNRSTA